MPTNDIQSLAIFCGANAGNNSKWAEHGYRTGRYLAEKNIALIFGGGKVGIMGALANGVLAGNGKVVGVIPNFLAAKEIMHDAVNEMIKVETMHERKLQMSQLADGFIIMPGGFGTLEEFFEILTWAQLGLHKKPIGMLNIDGFYEPLLAMVDKMVENGFLKELNKNMILVSHSIEDLLNKMLNFEAPEVDKWIKAEQI